MDRNLRDLYINFLISSSDKVMATTLSKMLGYGYSHDRFTKMLLDDNVFVEEELFNYIKPMIREYEDINDGIISIDDMIINKPYTDENDIVAWHYSHTNGNVVKGICMLNFLYTSKSENVSIPLGYELITKTLKYTAKDGKERRKGVFSKNEIMRDKLDILQNNNHIKYRYIVADSWFSSVENMRFIDEKLGKIFVFGLKSNRNVALNEDDKIKGKYCKIRDVDMEGCSSRLVYLKGYDKPLKVTRLFVKNGNDGEAIYSYLITNETINSNIFTIYKKRWKVEEYHKSLKQNLKIEKSPTKSIVSQNNHILLSVCGFVKLEKLKQNHNMNHFALKEKIYIKALNIAFKELERLKVA